MKIYPPFQVALTENKLVLKQKYQITFSQKRLQQLQTYLQSGLRIASGSINKEKPLIGTEKEIIKQIHTIRYNESNPYVITGGHFSPLFVRNMGIFFNALLDPRIPTSNIDWEQRQKIALKTVAFALENFKRAGKEFTTITQINKNTFTGLNLYARPSDSLHALVYTLNALIDDAYITETFPAMIKPRYKLLTHDAGAELLKTYGALLKKLLQTYHDELFDPETKLIKKELLLSSARDGIKRQSSFYDNVILWNTLRLGAKLRLYTITKQELQSFKQRILKTFWDDKVGIFLDDLSGGKQF